MITMTDMKSGNVLENERGSALVLVMIIMAVLSIIGISSINTTTTELAIVRNERIYQTNFYKAESAVMEGLQELETASFDQLGDRTFTTFVWLKKYDATLDMLDIANWNTATNSSASANLPEADYAIVEKGIVVGDSLDMTATSNMYDYVARGVGYSDNGRVLIEIGYKKRH